MSKKIRIVAYTIGCYPKFPMKFVKLKYWYSINETASDSMRSNILIRATATKIIYPYG